MPSKKQNGKLKITKRDGKICGEIHISIDMDDIMKYAVAAAEESYNNSSKAKKTKTSGKSKSKKSSTSTNSVQKKGEFWTYIDTDDKLDLFLDTAERLAPECTGIGQLAKKASDAVVSQFSNREFNFIKGSSDDNIRGTECTILKGNMKSVSDRVNDRVFKINVHNKDGSYSEEIINNPTEEALERHSNQYEVVDNPEDPSGVTHKLVQHPLEFYEGFEKYPNKKGNYISPEAQSYLNNFSDEEIQNYLKTRRYRPY